MDTESESATEALPVDLAAIRRTCERAWSLRHGRLVHDDVAAVHLALRGHLAVLLDDARELAARMPAGSFDRHRMDIHLQRLTQLHARPVAPSAGAAYSDVGQLVRGCEWLLTQLGPHGPS